MPRKKGSKKAKRKSEPGKVGGRKEARRPEETLEEGRPTPAGEPGPPAGGDVEAAAGPTAEPTAAPTAAPPTEAREAAETAEGAARSAATGGSEGAAGSGASLLGGLFSPRAPEVEHEPDVGFKEWAGGLGEGWRRDGLVQLAVIAGAALVLLSGLGFGLWDCWETHYAEVARTMLTRGDWIHPYWSDSFFHSKPILPFWLMATAMKTLGVVEWAIRLPFALHAVLLVWVVYFVTSRHFSTRAGLFAAAAVLTMPQFSFLARQAMADILVTTYVTMGLGFFSLAILGTREDRERAARRGTRPGITVPYVYVIYVVTALACLAKGFLGVGLPGAIVLAYLLFTWDWPLLRRVRILSGGIVWAVITLPWYAHMSSFEGRNFQNMTFWKRFIIYDHFRRIASGVHGERGHFTYFIQQMGYATLFWAGWIAAAVGSIARAKPGESSTDEKLRRFLISWWGVTLLVFTLSQTKFHHYIFPILPISAILVGSFLDRYLLEEGQPRYRLVLVLVTVVFVLVARDVAMDPRHLVNLFVYNYKRAYPWDAAALFNIRWQIGAAVRTIPVGLMWLLAVGGAGLSIYEWSRKERARQLLQWTGAILAVVGFGLLFIRARFPSAFVFQLAANQKFVLGTLTALTAAILLSGILYDARRYVVYGFLVMTGLLTAYNLGVYMPGLTRHWSQRGLYQTMAKESPYWAGIFKRTLGDGRHVPVPDEPFFAFSNNWRGEEFYSRNHVIQVMGTGSYQKMYRYLQRYRKPGRKVFFITEAKRLPELKRAVGYYEKRRLRVIDRSNNKHLLVVLDPPKGKEVRTSSRLKRDERERRRWDNWKARKKRRRRGARRGKRLGRRRSSRRRRHRRGRRLRGKRRGR